MFELSDKNRYYLCADPSVFRCGIDGLCRYVTANTPCRLMGGDAFVFFSRNRRQVKILRWDGDGFLLYQKRLAKGTFEMPRFCASQGCYELSWDTLYFLMRGLSLCTVKARKRLCT